MCFFVDLSDSQDGSVSDFQGEPSVRPIGLFAQSQAETAEPNRNWVHEYPKGAPYRPQILRIFQSELRNVTASRNRELYAKSASASDVRAPCHVDPTEPTQYRTRHKILTQKTENTANTRPNA